MKVLNEEKAKNIIEKAFDGYTYNDFFKGVIPVHVTGITTEKIYSKDCQVYEDSKVTCTVDKYIFAVATDLQCLHEISPLRFRESETRTRCRIARDIQEKIESILNNGEKFLVYTMIYSNGFQIEIKEFR